jgi:hypothetical protein
MGYTCVLLPASIAEVTFPMSAKHFGTVCRAGCGNSLIYTDWQHRGPMGGGIYESTPAVDSTLNRLSQVQMTLVLQ